MSSSQPFPPISQIREEIEEVERPMFRSEQNLLPEGREVENLNKERDALKTLHGLSELEKISMEEKLKKREVECHELSERVNRLIEEHMSAIEGKIQAEEKHVKSLEEIKRVESEGKKKMEELVRKYEELEERIRVFGDNERGKLASEYVSADVRKENDNDKKGTGETSESGAFKNRKSERSEAEGPSKKRQKLFKDLDDLGDTELWFMDTYLFQDAYRKPMPAAYQNKKEDVGAVFCRRACIMHRAQYLLPLEQVPVASLVEEDKEVEAKKREKLRDMIIAKYGGSNPNIHDDIFFCGLWMFCVGFAMGALSVKEKNPSIELSALPLFDPNLENVSKLKIMMDKLFSVSPEYRREAEEAQASG